MGFGSPERLPVRILGTLPAAKFSCQLRAAWAKLVQSENPMSLRLIELLLPRESTPVVLERIVNLDDVLEHWQESLPEKRISLKLLVTTEKSAMILDQLEKAFSGLNNFRLILYPVEASIPRPDSAAEAQNKVKTGPPSPKPISRFLQISREELYADIEKTVRADWTFYVLVILSAVVACLGILKNNEVIVIGAMVIAPLLGPNVALSFATTLGDLSLSRQAVKSIAKSIILALIPAVGIGLFVRINPALPALAGRTQVSLADVVLALAAGSAAAISVSSELFSALIGVMVAVALLPPLVSLGLLLGAGQWSLALGSLLLFLTNLICINLSGVVTFIFQGIRPLSWWESTKAKKATRLALFLWLMLLMILVVIILLS